MSGTSFSTWSLVEDPVHYAVKVASALNCSVPTNMMKNHQDIVKCLREKPLTDLHSVELKAPSFLTAMGPSRDGVLIPSDFGTSSFHIHRKRSTAPSYRIIVGVSDKETEELFSEEQLEEGISQHEQKRWTVINWSEIIFNATRLLRTLVRNTYMHHLNEIFYTVENEYSPVGAAATPQAVRGKVFATDVNLFLSLWRFLRPLGTSCTCRLPWRPHPGAMSPAMWFTSISIQFWSHQKKKMNVTLLRWKFDAQDREFNDNSTTQSTKPCLGGRDWAQRWDPSLGLWSSICHRNICFWFPDISCKGARLTKGIIAV